MFILTPKRQCTKCGEVKPLSEFYKHKDSRGGYRASCKACVRASNNIWKGKNLESAYAISAKWRIDNPEKAKALNRKSYLENRDSYIERARRWFSENRERRREIARNWNKENPEKVSANQRLRRARQRGSAGKITAQEWKNLKELYGFTCLRCKQREPEIKLTLDHVIPLALGGEHSISNAQPLCLHCNSWKGKKVIDYR